MTVRRSATAAPCAPWTPFAHDLDGWSAARQRVARADRAITTALGPATDAGAMVFCLGGLARGDLTPQADLDLLIVLPADTSAQVVAEQLVADGLRALWDRGFRLGHRVHTAADLVAHLRADSHAATAVLEARCLPRRDARARGQAFLLQLHADAIAPMRAALIGDKVRELLQRRHASGGSVHRVEPHLKNAPGGVRDIHTVIWIGLLLFPWRRDRIGCGDDALRHLLAMGGLHPREKDVLDEGWAELLALRTALHEVAQRRDDRLSFDVQRDIAARWGIDAVEGMAASERLMQSVFRRLLRVRTAVDDILDRWLDEVPDARHRWRRSQRHTDRGLSWRKTRGLAPGIAARGDVLFLDDPDLFQREPARIIDAHRLASEEDLLLSPRTRARARAVLDESAAACTDNDAARALLRLCRSRKVVGAPLTALLERGVLARVLVDMARLRGRFKPDGYHVLTHDAHICLCADTALRVASGLKEIPRPLSSSVRRTRRFHLLVLGALMHDIGKGLSGDHSERGVVIARREALRMGLAPGEVVVLEFLVREHLLLSRTSQRRDIGDPQVVREVAARVGSVERLDLLALLTWVDIASVAPGMFNDWKAQLLGATVERVAAYLAAPSEDATLRGREEDEVRDEVCAILRGHAASDIVRAFVDGASPRARAGRFSDELKDDLLAFAGFRRAGGKAFVDARQTRHEADTVRVVCADADMQLALLTQVLFRHGANILHAFSDARQDGVGLYAFRVDDGRGRRLDRGTLSHVLGALRAALDNDAPAFVARPRGSGTTRGFRVAPKVRIDPTPDTWGAIAVEVRAGDRPGLMADLAAVFSAEAFNVVLVKASTEGRAVRDTFFVVDAQRRIIDERRRRALERRLLDALDVGPRP